MKIEKRSVESLLPLRASYNPRKELKSGDSEYEKLKKSINEFGYVEPIILNTQTNTIVGGHQRLTVLQDLGYKEIDVVLIDIDETKEKALNVALNKISGSWDEDKLSLLLKELMDTDLDITLTGFDESDLSSLVEDVDLGILTPKEEPLNEDEFDPLADVPKRVSEGDLWCLGDHLLYCGDATFDSTYKTLLGTHKADLVFTDPPYGMKKEKDGVENDNLNYDDLLEFNKAWIPLSLNYLKDTGCWYCWGIDEPLMDIYHYILKPLKKENKIVIRNYLTWAKHSAFGINSNLALSFPKETEKCWFIMKGQDWNNNNTEFFNTKFERILAYMQQEGQKANIKPKDIERVCGCSMYSHWFSKAQFCILSEKHYKELQDAYPGCFEKSYSDLRSLLGDSNNPTDSLKPYFDNIAEENVGDIGLTDVWRFPVTSIKERELTGGHATPKPLALCRRGIKASSRPNEVVLDIFGGSGSTLIACEQLGRKCRMVELTPHYCDVIIHRWECLTGKKAEKVE